MRSGALGKRRVYSARPLLTVVDRRRSWSSTALPYRTRQRVLVVVDGGGAVDFLGGPHRNGPMTMSLRDHDGRARIR